jgi:hypothetical protein
MMGFICALISKMISLVWFYRETDGRYIHLVQAYEGLKRTGVPFVEYSDGKLFPYSAVDDIGIYEVIPRIALTFNCSLTTAIKIFMYGIPFVTYMSGVIAFWLIYKSTSQRLVMFFGLTALLFLTLYLGDVYIVYSSIVMLLIPWALYLDQKIAKLRSFQFYGFIAGTLIGLFDYFRGYAGLAPFLFPLFLFGGNKNIKNIHKKHLALAFIGGFFISNSIIYYSKYQYKQFAGQHFNGMSLDEYNHPIWHMIYIGLGFLKFGNIENIRFQDNCAGNLLEKKRALNPELNSISDEIILRNEVLRICREQNYFVIFTVFGKIGIMLLLLLFAANFGLLAAFFYRKSFHIDVSFAIGAAASALFPILTMPFLTYSLQFIAFGVIYGIISINYALDFVKNRAFFRLRYRLMRGKERAVQSV